MTGPTEADKGVAVLAVERRGRITLLRLERPEARNAINVHLTRALDRELDRIEADDDTLVTVLSHAPEVFCSGADRADIAAGRIADLVTERGGFAGLVARRRAKPLIAAVDGPAEAGGCEIALACDLVVGSAAACFVLPEAPLGKVAAAGGAFRLPRLLPPRVALFALLSGEGISAEAAHRFGLINDLVARGAAEEGALAMAERICRSGPLAVRETLALVRQAVFADETALWEMSRDALSRLKRGEADG